jgi:hypothetical protein
MVRMRRSRSAIDADAQLLASAFATTCGCGGPDAMLLEQLHISCIVIILAKIHYF